MDKQCSSQQLPTGRLSRLTDTEILSLNTYDFMAHLGKQVINPGGLHGRDRLLSLLDLRPGDHVLEIGCGTGQAACHIAERYGCKVTAIDISASMIESARRQVTRRGLSELVTCEVANITALPYATGQFDYVIAQAVLMFVDQNQALNEIHRTLKPGGRFAGLEFSWRQMPPDPVRDQTYRICGCSTLEFHSVEDWAQRLADNGIGGVQASEHPFNLLSIRGFLRDEGLGNSLQIAGKVLRRKANLVRMRQIWNHFSGNLDYFSYAVLSGQRGATS